MPRVLVAGGGIAGLVAARSLARRCEVVLVEAQPRLGGKIDTARFRDRPLELGPDAFITRDPAATDLCRSLGLDDELVAPAARSASVFAKGALHPLPAGLVIGIPTDLDQVAQAGLLGRRALARARLDRVFPTRMSPAALDTTVARLVRPRLGRAVIEHLVDPLIGGINASDVEVLSFAAALPQLVPAVEGRRSLTRALAPLARRSPSAAPVFYGLRTGFSRLIERLVADCRERGAQLRTGTELHRLVAGHPHAGLRCELAGGEELDVDGVVLALPAPDAARVLASAAPAMSRGLASIEYASVATVTLALGAEAVPPDLGAALGGRAGEGLVGSGVLVARAPRRLVTAVTFTSTKWPHSARAGEVVVRASVGRHRDRRALELDDGALVAAVRRELAAVLGVNAEPLEVLVRRWPDSFPQYTRGHLARVARIESLGADVPGLALAGAALRGIGIPACVRSGEAAADAVGAHLFGC